MNKLKESKITKLINNINSLPAELRKVVTGMLGLFESGYKRGYLDARSGLTPKYYIKRIQKPLQ